MNTKVKVIGLTPLKIKPKFTAPEVDALTAWSSELLMPVRPTSLHLSSVLETKTKKQTHLCNVMADGCDCFLLLSLYLFVDAELEAVWEITSGIS